MTSLRWLWLGILLPLIGWADVNPVNQGRLFSDLQARGYGISNLSWVVVGSNGYVSRISILPGSNTFDLNDGVSIGPDVRLYRAATNTLGVAGDLRAYNLQLTGGLLTGITQMQGSAASINLATGTLRTGTNVAIDLTSYTLRSSNGTTVISWASPALLANSIKALGFQVQTNFFATDLSAFMHGISNLTFLTGPSLNISVGAGSVGSSSFTLTNGFLLDSAGRSVISIGGHQLFGTNNAAVLNFASSNALTASLLDMGFLTSVDAVNIRGTNGLYAQNVSGTWELGLAAASSNAVLQYSVAQGWLKVSNMLAGTARIGLFDGLVKTAGGASTINLANGDLYTLGSIVSISPSAQQIFRDIAGAPVLAIDYGTASGLYDTNGALVLPFDSTNSLVQQLILYGFSTNALSAVSINGLVVTNGNQVSLPDGAADDDVLRWSAGDGKWQVIPFTNLPALTSPLRADIDAADHAITGLANVETTNLSLGSVEFRASAGILYANSTPFYDAADRRLFSTNSVATVDLANHALTVGATTRLRWGTTDFLRTDIVDSGIFSTTELTNAVNTITAGVYTTPGMTNAVTNITQIARYTRTSNNTTAAILVNVEFDGILTPITLAPNTTLDESIALTTGFLATNQSVFPMLSYPTNWITCTNYSGIPTEITAVCMMDIPNDLVVVRLINPSTNWTTLDTNYVFRVMGINPPANPP